MGKAPIEELVNQYINLFNELPPKMKMKNYTIIEDLIRAAIETKKPIDKKEAQARYLKRKTPKELYCKSILSVDSALYNCT